MKKTAGKPKTETKKFPWEEFFRMKKRILELERMIDLYELVFETQRQIKKD